MRGPWRKQLLQLQRIRDKKVERLASWKPMGESSENAKGYLKADVLALNFAIDVIEKAEAHGVLEEILTLLPEPPS